VEDEVGVAVVERAVLDNVALRAVDAAHPEGEVLQGRVLDAGRPLVNGLRLQVRVNRSAVAAEVAEVGQRRRARRSVQAVDADVEVDLLVVAARADVQVERYGRLNELREVSEDLAAALSGEVPDEAEARLRVVNEVVELE